jgi:hypothetical protein
VRRRRYEPDRLRQARPFMAAYRRLLPGAEPADGPQPRDWQRFPDAHPDKPPILPADWRENRPKTPEESKNAEKHGRNRPKGPG